MIKIAVTAKNLGFGQSGNISRERPELPFTSPVATTHFNEERLVSLISWHKQRFFKKQQPCVYICGNGLVTTATIHP